VCTWVYFQRFAYKSGKLSAWKIEKLNAIGFEWSPVISEWQKRFERFKNHKEKQNDCELSKGFLFSWEKTQRDAYKRGDLEPWKIEKLNAIDFEWSPMIGKWQKRFEQIKSHKEKQNNFELTKGALLKWVRTQRQAYKKGRLEPWKIEKLNAIGFEWNPWLSHWKENFEVLKTYHQENGCCNTAFNTPIKGWLTQQRQAYKKGRLESWKIEKLNGLGIYWDPLGKRWQHFFDQLQEHKQKYGDFKFIDKTSYLYAWILKQRNFYKKGCLEDSRKELLDSLGFNWNGRSLLKD